MQSVMKIYCVIKIWEKLLSHQNSLIFEENAKFPDFSLTGKMPSNFPWFPEMPSNFPWFPEAVWALKADCEDMLMGDESLHSWEAARLKTHKTEICLANSTLFMAPCSKWSTKNQQIFLQLQWWNTYLCNSKHCFRTFIWSNGVLLRRLFFSTWRNKWWMRYHTAIFRYDF